MANINRDIIHRFLDEVGDTTFFGKGDKPLIGSDGVSLTFGMGVVKIDRPVDRVRAEIAKMHREIAEDPFFNVIPSVQKRIEKGGFFFHACKDSPEVRAIFFKYLDALPCKADVVIARKDTEIFVKRHQKRQDAFYAEVLAHTIKRLLKKKEKVVLNIADRGSSTRTQILESALKRATEMAAKRWGDENVNNRTVFNVQSPRRDPLLCVADYICWSVQRVFESGDLRFYNYLREKKIRVVIDLYDKAKWKDNQNYYDGKRNPLTIANCIKPQK